MADPNLLDPSAAAGLGVDPSLMPGAQNYPGIFGAGLPPQLVQQMQMDPRFRTGNTMVQQGLQPGPVRTPVEGFAKMLQVLLGSGLQREAMSGFKDSAAGYQNMQRRAVASLAPKPGGLDSQGRQLPPEPGDLAGTIQGLANDPSGLGLAPALQLAEQYSKGRQASEFAQQTAAANKGLTQDKGGTVVAQPGYGPAVGSIARDTSEGTKGGEIDAQASRVPQLAQIAFGTAEGTSQGALPADLAKIEAENDYKLRNARQTPQITGPDQSVLITDAPANLNYGRGGGMSPGGAYNSPLRRGGMLTSPLPPGAPDGTRPGAPPPQRALDPPRFSASTGGNVPTPGSLPPVPPGAPQTPQSLIDQTNRNVPADQREQPGVHVLKEGRNSEQIKSDAEFRKGTIDNAKTAASSDLILDTFEKAIDKMKEAGRETGTGSTAVMHLMAGAKAIGIDTKKFTDMNVSDPQTAAAVAKELYGEVLKRMYPGRITNIDMEVNKGITPDIELTDETNRRLMARMRAQNAYDKGLAGAMLDWERNPKLKAEYGNNLSDFQGTYYKKNGYGPMAFGQPGEQAAPGMQPPPTVSKASVSPPEGAPPGAKYTGKTIGGKPAYELPNNGGYWTP